MGSSGGEKATKIVTEKIKAKKGKAIASFIVKTYRVKEEDIIKRGEEIAEEFIRKKGKN